MHVFVLVYLKVGKDALGNQKKVLDTLELELQMVELYPTWVVGFELLSSERTRSVSCCCCCFSKTEYLSVTELLQLTL